MANPFDRSPLGALADELERDRAELPQIAPRAPTPMPDAPQRRKSPSIDAGGDERGHRDAAEIGCWIARHPPLPDLALVSPAVRTTQTFEIVREALTGAGPAPKVDFVPELYGADPALLLTAKIGRAHV